MVRVFLKGGVWKNSEDEILKAAVQKYGKQQWARVASLLNRKSAKQAKARWYEWLDPSIRKTEWSSTEEEKLLHLAKLMPAQWKTIAITIGRTATQCQEHYEYLLDQAATAASDTSGGADLGQASTTLLRAGQIDSHPESKPARPDPIDMDEDEMEMLQEARARLANTMGKKAKRKQRERALAAAKRLADLQKRRELKQAGLISKAATKRSKLGRRNIDLGVEIPFHKPAPIGFHDVSGENQKSEQILAKHIKSIDYRTVNEQQYRTRDREAAMIRKKEESRLRILQDSNDKYLKDKKKQDEQNEVPALTFKRGPLKLPEPTITDSDYEHIAKLQQQQEKSVSGIDIEDGSHSATRALLGDYKPTLASAYLPPAPGRESGSTQQSIMKEATYLRQLQRGQTPLLIQNDSEQQQQELQDYDDDKSEMDRKPAARQSSSSASVFSSKTNRSAITNVSMPLVRDQLGLNRKYSISEDGETLTAGNSQSLKRTLPSFSETENAFDDTTSVMDAVSVGASTYAASATSTRYSIRELARNQRRIAKRARQELDAAFASLPAPQFEYELSAPSVAENDEDDKATSAETSTIDRADIEAAELEQIRIDAQISYEKRSSVLKRTLELPRPPSHCSLRSYQSIVSEDEEPITAGDLSKYRTWIRQEMQALIHHDAYEFPLPDTRAITDSKKKAKKDKKTKKKKQDDVATDEGLGTEVFLLPPPSKPLDELNDKYLSLAKEMITNELEIILNEKFDSLQQSRMVSNKVDALDFLSHQTSNAVNDGNSNLVYTVDGWTEWVGASDDCLIQSLKLEVQTLDDARHVLKRKNDKLVSKLHVVTDGYNKVAEKSSSAISVAFTQIQESDREFKNYKQLLEQEKVAGKRRIQSLRNDIAQLKQSHIELQRHYGELVLRKRRSTILSSTTA